MNTLHAFSISIGFVMCSCSSVNAQDIAITRAAKDETYKFNESAVFRVRNNGARPVELFYEAEVLRDGKWRPWGHGPVSGNYNEISEPFVMRGGEQNPLVSAIKKVPMGPSLPQGATKVSVNSRLTFRLKVSVEPGGRSYYSDRFYFERPYE